MSYAVPSISDAVRARLRRWPRVAALLLTSIAATPAMASNISGGTIIALFSEVVTSGQVITNPGTGQRRFYDNSATADYRIVNSANPATAGSPPLQSNGSALIWGDNNNGAGQVSTLDFFGAPIPARLDQNFELGRITYTNGTSTLPSLIFGATISFYANSVSTASFLGSDHLSITTTSNLGQSPIQDSDYINICGNQSNICGNSINAIEVSEGGTGVTVDLFGTIVGDPQLFINQAMLTPGQSSMTNGFIGSNTPPVPLPASAPLFGAAVMMLGAFGYGLKLRREGAAV